MDDTTLAYELAPNAYQPRPVPASPPPVAAKPKAPTFQATGVDWCQQMYVFTVLLLVGYGIWVLDSAFTVVGAVTTVLPATVLDVGIALAIHFSSVGANIR